MELETYRLHSVCTGNVRGSYFVMVEDQDGDLHRVDLEQDGDEWLLASRNRCDATPAETFVASNRYVLDQVDELALSEAREDRRCMMRYGRTP